MMFLAQTIDKAFAAFIICTTLAYFTVDGACPAAEDARANSCRLTYESLADGNITRKLNIFAGKLTASQCIAHCGCVSRSYAGLDSHGHCFCGSELGTNCTTEPECMRVYATAGVPAFPTGTFPTKMELFSTGSATINGLSNVIKFAVEVDGKLSYFSPSSGKVSFVETGERKASMEVEAYWGCRTPDYTVNVYSPLQAALVCPIAVRPSEEFSCSAEFIEGSGIQSIQWKLDGAPNGAAITNVGEPLVYATGGNLTVDRFESFNNSFDYSNGETVTFVNLNYEFTAVGRVRAFEAHFTKLGEVRFQIFRPMCDPSQIEKTYCHSERKCVASGCGTPSNRLGDIEFYPPASKPVFCPDVERFKPDDNNTCPQPPTLTVPQADYMLMYEFAANVTQKGNMVFKVPDDQTFTVYPGFVLGWTTGPNNNSADIGFYSYDEAYEQMYPEYQYKECYERFTGSVFSRKLPTASLFTKYHLLRAHTISQANYLKKMTLSNLGQPYTIGLTVTAAESSVSKSMEIAVETDITAFTLSATHTQILTDVENTFAVSSINTEVGVSYSFFFGETPFNGTFGPKQSTKTIKKSFALPGIYTVICRAENKLNSVDRNITIYVYSKIDQIGFTKDVDPKSTGEFSISTFKISGGGNATVTYLLGDNSVARILNVTLTPYFFAEIGYKYATDGDYLINVEAKHPLETKKIDQYAAVENIVNSVVIAPPGVAATNVTHPFRITSHTGTNVTFVWDWADGTPKINSSFNQKEYSHKYTTYGNRTITVYASNLVSNFTTTVFVEVQDIIKGLNFSQQAGSVYAIAPTNASAATTVWFEMLQGTGVDIFIDWDSDDATTTVLSSKAYNLNKDNPGTKFIGRGTHSYTTVKTYNVTVHAKNEVSNMSVKAIAVYETPISGGTFTFVQKDLTTTFIEVNETVCFTMKPASGTNILVRYDFNDTTSSPVTTPNTTHCTSWPYWQRPMYTKFRIYNNVSSVTKAFLVNVERPVHNFTTLSISGGPENTTEAMVLVLSEKTGDFFNCSWTIKDTTTVNKNSTYSDFLNGIHVKHQFATTGIFDVSVFCSNRLYSASAKINVSSYVPVSEFEASVLYGGACGAKKSAGDKGDGPDLDMYAFGCPLKFVVSGQTGSNVTYHFDFDEENSKGATTSLPETTHTFQQSPVDQKTIKITVSNPTSTRTQLFPLKFLPRITGLKIGNSGPIKVGKEVSINVTVAQKGYKSCFLVECQTSRDIKTHELFTSQFWMGDDSCRDKTKYKPIVSKPDLNPTKAIWPQKYEQTGKFRCIVIGENDVSLETAFTDIVVLDKPCNKPKVEWSDISTVIEDPANVTKGKTKLISVKLTKDCEKTDLVEYNWNISSVKAGTFERTVVKSINHTKEDTALKIPARSLDYGLYEIGLSLCMKDVYPPVCTPIIGYITIRPSRLVAQFEGGSGRAGGQNRMLPISASPSHDPDVGPTMEGLKLRWFCKLQSENFPSDYDSMPEIDLPKSGPAPEAKNYTMKLTSNFTGCFGNGIGRLKGFDDVTTLQINSSYMPLKQFYTIRILLWKPTSRVPRENVTADYSLFIVPGDPPEIKIKCIVNCEDKKNPDKPFKLQAICIKDCGAGINYKWSLQKKNVGESDDKLKNVTDFSVKDKWLTTSITNKNLAMKENMMTSNFEYVVRLTGSLAEDEGTYGFSLYSIVVNVPPKVPISSSSCQVRPLTGKPLAKIFKGIMSGFQDDDVPLTYLMDYRATGTDKEEDWINFHNSLSQISDLLMLPEGPKTKDYKVEVRYYVEDLYRAKSDYVYGHVIVKSEKKDAADLSSVLEASKGSTDPAAAGMVANAVLTSLDSDDSGDSSNSGSVVSSVVDLMNDVDVNSDAGALALASTMSKCMGTGQLSPDAQAKAMKAMAKCANQMGPDTPPEIVSSVATNAFTVLLTGSETGGGDAEDSDSTVRNLGTTLAGNMVAGEAPFQKKSGKSMIACQAMEPGSGGKVSLGSGGDFDMDSSQLGESGTAFQAVGGNGPDKYSNKSSAAKDVTSDVVSLDMAAGGQPLVVKNLSKPIKVKIKQPINPYPPTQHTSYTHLLKTVSLVSNPSDNLSSIFIDIRNTSEMNDSCFFVIIKKGLKPKLYDNDFNFTLPHVVTPFKPNGENKSEEEMKLDYTNRYRIFLHGARDLREAAIGMYYVAVLNSPCNTTNVSLPIMTSLDVPGPLNLTIPPINYTFQSYTGVCKFFNKTSKKWSTSGLEITQETTQNFTVCLTTHLSSFAGGSVFAKPNTIDFSKAFAGFSNIGENPTVFATTLSIIGIYFVLLAYCRYKDKKDVEKIGVFPLEDNHPSDNYLYEVSVQTGFKKGAGTTADVFIVLNGNLGETSPRKLKNPNRKCFEKGETDAFLVTTPFSLGQIKSVEVWHNNAGNSPGWYCMQVQIRDVQTDKKFIFVCNRWLAVEEDDGEIKRKIEIATKNDLVQFDFLFAQTARKNLYDGHIWFSVFTRPPRSHFTRCQRLGCCLTLLLTSMLANAMFYKDPAPASSDPNAPAPEPSDSIHLGPITISVEQIKIGFTSSLVVVPVNLIIATLFQKAKPREEKKKEKSDKYSADADDDEESSIGSTRNLVSTSKIDLIEANTRPSTNTLDNEPEPELTEEEREIEKSKKRANFLKMICFPGNEDDEGEESSGKSKKKPKPKATLPHWVIYIAYVLIFAASGAAAFFVILYGFQFGKEKSDNWMKSMMLSFWQSVLVIQPVKVLALSVLVAMIIKDPKAASGEDEGGSKSVGKDDKGQEGKKKKKKVGEDGEEEESSDEEADEDEAKRELEKNLEFKLPDEKKLEESRKLRLKEKQMKSIIREIVIHLLFVMLCLFIGYSNLDPFAQQFGTGVRNFVGDDLEQVTRVEQYWSWIEDKFIPYLFPGTWYNGDPYMVRFVADTEPSKIISMARMRQLRVKKNTCTKHPVFKYIVSECNGAYSWSNEDTEQYSAGWKPPLNKTETRKLRHRKRKALWLGLENPWQYQSVLKLKNFPFLGKFATYGGSSYAVSVGPDERISRLIIKDMKDNFWIDRYTRAVFVEFNIYNANTNLMMIVTLLSEVLQTGGWNYFYNVQAIRLYRWQGGLGGLIVFADLTFMIVTLVGLYKLVKNCKKEGVKNYLKSAWNFLHAFVTVFSICTFSCVFARVGAVMYAMKQYKKEPEVFVSFAYLGQLDYFVQAFIGFVVMATNLEFLRLLRFNKKIGLLTATIRQSMKPLASFGLIFTFIFMSYVSLAHLLFVDQLEDYKNFGTSVVSLTRMFLGQFDVYAYMKAAPLLGPMLFLSYMVTIQMVLINMFIGIICETFEEVRLDIEKQSNDHEIVSFMTNRFKKIAGAAVGPSVDPIYREWKSDWEMTLDSIEEKSDSIVYLMRNIEAEEVRQTQWMEPTKANEKKRNLLKLLVGSDEFTYENEILDSLTVLDKRMKKLTVDKSRKMVYTMAKKKKKDRDEEVKSRTDEQSFFSEEESEDEDQNENVEKSDSDGDE
ncbi:uncharacterized protein LOC135692255 [Rhopilema esculentum]|uniref:uncharacterized protein LOC135692255 n=1 Tax=Rhopilema esculentum TaxID=499914 RepID=UPI0031D9C774